MPKCLNTVFYLVILPTAIGVGETPGLIPNPEVKPDPVPRGTVFREGTGSAEAVGIQKVFKLSPQLEPLVTTYRAVDYDVREIGGTKGAIGKGVTRANSKER